MHGSTLTHHLGVYYIRRRLKTPGVLMQQSLLGSPTRDSQCSFEWCWNPSDFWQCPNSLESPAQQGRQVVRMDLTTCDSMNENWIDHQPLVVLATYNTSSYLHSDLEEHWHSLVERKEWLDEEQFYTHAQECLHIHWNAGVSSDLQEPLACN